jgi:hypothetical protein
LRFRIFLLFSHRRVLLKQIEKGLTTLGSPSKINQY